MSTTISCHNDWTRLLPVFVEFSRKAKVLLLNQKFDLYVFKRQWNIWFYTLVNSTQKKKKIKKEGQKRSNRKTLFNTKTKWLL